MQEYLGEVAFPADAEPFQGDYGPRYSVKFRLVDAAGNPVAAPPRCRTDKEGRVSVFASPTDPVTPYLRSLQRNQVVKLMWTGDSNAKKTSMDLVVPAEYAGVAPQPVPMGTPAPTRPVPVNVPSQKPMVADQPQVWYPLTDEEMDAFLHIAGTMMDTAIVLMTTAQVKLAQAGFGEVKDLRVLQALAATGYIQAGREYKRGMTVHKPAQLDEAESVFLAGIDNSSEESLVASVLDGIAVSVSMTRQEVAELLKSFGLTRAELTGGQESQLFLLNVARTYYEAAKEKSQAECRRLIEDKFGLKDASIF